MNNMSDNEGEGQRVKNQSEMILDLHFFLVLNEIMIMDFVSCL